jgi:hypothetical protein
MVASMEDEIATLRTRLAAQEARAQRVEQALRECLVELEAAVLLLAREGVIHSASLGKDKRDGFRAALSQPAATGEG